MITLVCENSWDGQNYRIDAVSEDQARDWLWSLVLDKGPHKNPSGSGLWVKTFATHGG